MTRPRTLLTLLCCAAVAVLTIVALAGPERGDDSETTPAAGDAEHSIDGLGPDTAGPAEAAQQALAALFTWQPVTDASTGVALSRARPWLAGELARASQYPLATGVREPPHWAGWRRSGDIVTAHAVAQASPECHRDSCTVTVLVTQTVLHRDGASTPYQVMHVNAATQYTTEGWKLSDYRIEQ